MNPTSVQLKRIRYPSGHRRMVSASINGQELPGVRKVTVAEGVDDLSVVTIEFYADVEYIEEPVRKETEDERN